MALVSRVPAILQPRMDLPRCRDIGISKMMASRGEIVEEPAQVVNDTIYIAVGKDIKESKLTMRWALQKFKDKKICILHVHQPPQMIPFMGGKCPAKMVEEQEVRAYWELERHNMQKILNAYLLICDRAGVQAENLHTEMVYIEKGIVELISQRGIRNLVMGAAADKHYSKKMIKPKSKKANYVGRQAPISCQIWFICNGRLINMRKDSLDGVDMGIRSLSLQSSPIDETVQSNPFRSLSVGTGGVSTTQSSLDAEGCFDDWAGMSRRSPSQSSGLSTSSSSEVVGDLALIPLVRTEGSKDGAELLALPDSKKDVHHSSPLSVLEGSINDEICEQLEQAITEADNSRREAFDESVRRGKAEKDAIEAIRRAKASERIYNEELKQRKEIEEALAKENEQLGKMKRLQDDIMEELRISQDQKSLLERQIADSDQMVKELEEKIISAVQLLQNYKKERDELQIERDNAVKVAEELRKKRAESVSTHMPQFFSEFSFSEIEGATHNFDPSLKIGEGGYGSIYRGILRYTQVAIKMLHSHSMQGPSEFQQEVDILSNLRHPNLVTLIGACPEAWTLIYEYVPNGSLEDRLNCKDNTPPLSWQTRIRIAAELCSVLIFLHSTNPHSIVHGDLKPANVLLDANFVSKLSDFGICRLITSDENSRNDTTLCCRTVPKGTFAYMDPEFLTTGELTPKSDVYSFGIILLQLLTGRPPLGIALEVQYALDKGNLNTLLDPSAGDWPFVQAKQLAHLALRCCEMSRKSRPDLESEVWRVLEPMKVSCGALSSFRLGSEEHFQIPSYFICPIFLEIMQDPHVAADGFTYEAEALKGWLDGGHDTSPMTNDKLAHCDLVPNHALRSAIQEWLQQA